MPGRSIFLVSSSWASIQAPQIVVSVESVETRFVQNHRLEAILVSDHGGNAMINGHAVTVGQTVDGFRLVSVDRNTAVLERDDVRVNLKLDLNSAAGAGLSFR